MSEQKESTKQARHAIKESCGIDIDKPIDRQRLLCWTLLSAVIEPYIEWMYAIKRYLLGEKTRVVLCWRNLFSALICLLLIHLVILPLTCIAWLFLGIVILKNKICSKKESR